MMNFPIVSREAELIVPASPTPHEMKALSEVDNQECLRFYYEVIMFYNHNDNPYPSSQGLMDPVHLIRQALAKTLVYYYPLSGRLLQGPHHSLLLDCTAEGVLFVEADAAVSLRQLGHTILPPCPHKGLLLNHELCSNGVLGCPLLLLQVTRFKCGGFALALRVSHVISDGPGSLQFVTALSEIAKGATTPSILPVWERNILTPRCPPRVTHAHPEYELRATNTIISSVVNDKNLVSKSFFFGPEEVKAIRTSLPPECRSGSTFDLITACLWRSRSRALEFHPDHDLRVSCAVTLRGKNSIELPLGYYGNAMIHPAGVAKASTLCSSGLDYAVKVVREARMRATEDYSRSVIDYLATMGRPTILDPWNFVVSDLSKLGFDEVDLGWGKPVYGGTMDGGTNSGTTIYGRCRNREGKDVVVVAVALPVEVMERFENEVRCSTQCKHVNVNVNVMVSSKL